MIGLDTNVILRYVAQDDPIQSAVATRLFESFNPEKLGFISAVTMVEVVWVLQSSYEATREQIAEVLQALMRSRDLIVEQKDLFWSALTTYVRGNADFTDCLIERLGHSAGCDYTVTFGRKASSTAGMKLLS